MKSLKPKEVLSLIQQKVDLKRTLRSAKKNGEDSTIDNISKKIHKIESKLHKSQLQKP